MKRKVIKQGHNTLTITLPKKWCDKLGVKSGDEIEVEEKEDSISISTKKHLKLEEIEIDLSTFDKTTIVYYLRHLYRNGFNTIKLRYRNQFTIHHPSQKEYKIYPIIESEVLRLMGVEILEHKKDYCLLQCMVEENAEEFDKFLRRIFFLLPEMMDNLINALANGDKISLELIEKDHDITTKFISFCIRLLNKLGYKDYQKTILMHTLLESIDIIVDLMEDVSHIGIDYGKPVKKEVLGMLMEIKLSLGYFKEFFYRFNFEYVKKISNIRYTIIKKMDSNTKKLTEKEKTILWNARLIAMVITRNMVGVRLGMEH